jgi:hypothetical protein
MKNGRKTMNCFYRKLFDEPYMYLPEEIDDEDEGEYKKRNEKILAPLFHGILFQKNR